MDSVSKVLFLSEYLKPASVVFDLKAKDKVQALDELCDVLAKQKHIANKKLILTRLIDRERLETTGIGDHVALPHARVDTGGEVAVAVGRSEKGIDFESADNKKVHLIILVVWNPSIPGLFNHLFAGLAKFLRRPEFRHRAFQAKDKADLYKVLSEIELMLPLLDMTVSRASLIKRLQEIEIKRNKATREQKKALEKESAHLREELDQALLARFDRLMQRYGFAVADVAEGACQGCNINVATGMSAAIEGSNDIYICENCGKFLVAARAAKPVKKKKK
ncbi:MAG: PTS sugar transporter subunit IIA [Candidatus Aminicenantes bacterium]|nr:PTS sugar transporter subunit IIA [Candidatus Aminicenantes bacterium]